VTWETAQKTVHDIIAFQGNRLKNDSVKFDSSPLIRSTH